MPRVFVDFDRAKRVLKIPELMEQFGVDMGQFVRRGDELRGPCPLPQHVHNSVKPNKSGFSVNMKDGLSMFRCWGDCQVSGNAIQFIKLMAEFDDFAHVRLWISERYPELNEGRQRKSRTAKSTGSGKAGGDTVQKQMPQAGSEMNGTARDELVAGSPVKTIKPLSFRLNLDLEAAMPYLQQRGITRETAERYGVGLCRGRPGRKKPVLDGYLAIPIYRWPCPENENPVGYIGRWPGEDFDPDDDRPRYKIPGGFEVSHVVYGLNEALDQSNSSQPLIVVEGVFKVWYLIQCGFPSAVATCTAALSDAQAKLLLATGRSIVLLFDGNQAGFAGMRKAAAKLITQTWTRVVKLDENVEPDDLSPDQLRQLLSFAH